MTTVEIRHDKIKAIKTITFFLFCVIGSTYFVYFTDKFIDRVFLQYIMLPVNAFMLFMTYKFALKVLDKEVIIKLTRDGIQIKNESRKSPINWSEVQNLLTDKTDKGCTLTIQTTTGTYSLDIDGLDKSPQEIDRLLVDFKKAAYNKK